MKVHVVLLGGGHSNALALLELSSDKSVELTLINDGRYSFYSGMLPGVIANQYITSDLRIDLRALSEKYRFTFIENKGIKIVSEEKCIYLKDGIQIKYDILSINIGSTSKSDIPGIKEFTITTRPLYSLIDRILSINNAESFSIVGGGIAGIEIAFALRARHQKSIITIIQKGEILKELSERTRNLVERHLARSNILIYLQEVSEIQQNTLIFADSSFIHSEYIIWAAGAQACFLENNLPLSHDGYFLVRKTMQSVLHDDIFAVGDCNSIEGYQNFPPKAGVYAVREAEILVKNIKTLIKGNMALIEYTPQKDFLKIINLCNGTAIANKLGRNYEGKLAWILKNKIDRSFMNRFSTN